MMKSSASLVLLLQCNSLKILSAKTKENEVHCYIPIQGLQGFFFLQEFVSVCDVYYNFQMN